MTVHAARRRVARAPAYSPYMGAGPGPGPRASRPTTRLGTAVPLAAQSVGALPTNVDLVLYRGDDFFLDVAVLDGAGAPLDLTGYTASAQVRATPDEPDPPAATFTATIAGSTVSLHLPSVESAVLPATAAWDVQIVDGTGIVTTLAYGAVATTLDVTRP